MTAARHRVFTAARRAGVGLRATLVRHRVFATVLCAGVALRASAELGYRFAIWFNDSFDYLEIALRPRPDPMRPMGYPLLLWLVKPLHSLAVVTSVQHALGLGVAVLVYALLRRFSLPGWAATLAAAPVLLDAFQVQLEHLLLADTLFTFLVIAAVAVVCRSPESQAVRTSIWRAAVAGTLLAAAVLTRPIGIALIVLVICYLGVCRMGWRAITAASLAACAPLAGYVLWFHALTGQFAFDSTDGIYLWGRTAAFADCRVIKPPPSQAWLCPGLPVSQRAASSSQIWQPTSPFHWQHGQVFAAEQNSAALRFALRAIAAQPGAYARTVLASTGRAFTWDRTAYPTGYTASLYTFAGAKTWLPTWPEPDRRSAAAVARAYADGKAAMVTAEPFASAMRWYQRYLYLRGPMLAVILLIPPAVGLTISLRGRTFSLRGRSTEGRSAADPVAAALRRMSWLCWCSAAALLVIPPVTVDFDYRYVLPVVPFGCLAAALAVLRLAVFAGGTDAGQNPGRAGTSAAASMRTVHELTRSDS